MRNGRRARRPLLAVALAGVAAACSGAASGVDANATGSGANGSTAAGATQAMTPTSSGSGGGAATTGSTSETSMATGGAAATGTEISGAAGAGSTEPTMMAPVSTGGAPGASDGPCETPPLRFDVVVDTDYDICVSEPPLLGNLPFNIKMSCGGQPCPGSALFPVDRNVGYSFTWDAQLIDVGEPVCTDGIDGSCTTTASIPLCAFDDPDASAYLPTNADGQNTMTGYARLVTPRGTCSNDLLTAQIVVDPSQGSVVTIRSSDYVLLPVPETFECAGATCSGAAEYCRADYVVGESGATLVDGVCVPYPSECESDHTCECILPERPDDVGCADNGLRGTTQVLDHL